MRKSAVRAAAISGALIGWAGLCLQAVLTAGLIRAQGGNLPDALWRYLGFFTILANMLAAAVLSLAVFRPNRHPRLDFAACAAMVLVGIVYTVLLRHLQYLTGLDRLADLLLHDVMPVVTLLYWLLRPHGGLKPWDVAASAILPVVYCVYALTRGAFDGWYPYPFLNVARFGGVAVAYNCLGLMVAFAVLASLLWLLDRRLKR